MQAQINTVERTIAPIASRQHGVVTRSQLFSAGITRQELTTRVKRGGLIRVHRGVYRVGHRAPSVRATYLAAVLAGGPDARLAGRAAAYLWGIVRGAAPPPEVLTTSQRRTEGVKTTRVRALHPSDVTSLDAIPITTLARTIVDLAAELSTEDLARVCHEAGVRYRLTPNAVVAVLKRRPRTKGAAKLVRIIQGDELVVLSKLEAEFLRLLRRAHLPLPVTNRPAGGRRVDCRWPVHRLTVELDGYRFHNSRHSWEQDRRREREARARGDDFRRYTWGDVTEDPTDLLAELASFFNASSSSPKAA